MADCSLFREDEVYRVSPDSGEKTWGLILENSAFLDSSDEEDEEDEEFERLKPGEVRVAWYPDGEEEVLKEDNVVLDDRSLMPSDVVRRGITGANLQRGFVRRVQVRADVQVCDTSVAIPNVKAEDLKAMQQFEVDTDVALGSWLGQVRRVEEVLTLRFPDGAKVIMKDVDAQELEQVSKARKLREGTEFDTAPWYRGQKLSGTLSHFQDVEWVKSSNRFNADATKQNPRRSKKIKVTIEEVKLASMEVHWICRGFSRGDDPHSKAEAPPRHVKGNDITDLRKLNCFEHCSIQLGDPNLYVLKAEDIKHLNEVRDRLDSERLSGGDKVVSAAVAAGDSEKSGAATAAMNGDCSPSIVDALNNRANCDKNKAGAAAGDSQGAAAAGGDDSEYEDDDDDDDDEKDDNDEEGDNGLLNVDETSGRRRRRSGGLTNRTRRLKIKTNPPTTTKNGKKNKNTKKELAVRNLTVGSEICVEVIRTQSFVDVVWQDGSIEDEIPSAQLYPIHHVDEQDYFPGDFCVKGESSSVSNVYGVVQESDHRERTCRVLWFRPYVPGKGEQKPARLEIAECSVYDIKDHPDFGCGPGSLVIRISGFEDDNDACVGQIIEPQIDGQVNVTWSNGMTSLCHPQDLFLCGEGELNSLFGDDTEEDWEGSSEQSWETESEDSEWDSEESEIDNVEDQVFENLQGILDEHVSERERSDIAKAIKESLKDIKGEVKKELQEEMKRSKKEDKSASASDGFAMMPVTRKKLLDTLEKSIAALKRLNEIFAARQTANAHQLPGVEVSFVFKEILHLFHCCRDMDRLMETCFFDESLFDGHLADIRKRLRKEKQDKIASRVLHRLEAQQNAASHVEEDGDERKADADSKDLANGDAAAAATDTKQNGAAGTDENDSEFGFIWELCSKVCNLLSGNISEAKEEISKRVTQLKSDVEMKEDGGDKDAAEAAAVESVDNPVSKDDSSTSLGSTTPDGAEAAPSTVVQPAEAFLALNSAPESHKFYAKLTLPVDQKAFATAVRKELKLMASSLPNGIFVRSYEDRMDLFSFMIVGSTRTPYEDGVFLFEAQLPPEYPKSPPVFHYVSYCSERLNPNLYEDGKVCVSLLGTWNGKGTEVWNSRSSLLQVLVSIQGLILVAEPYYNEAGYERQKGSKIGAENARMYNEMAVLKMTQHMGKMAQELLQRIRRREENDADINYVWKNELSRHFKAVGTKFVQRLENYLDDDEIEDALANGAQQIDTTTTLPNGESADEQPNKPLHDFPLLPVSKGFKLTLKLSLTALEDAVKEIVSL